MMNPGRARVLAWALWDCGATGVNAIVVTFVFSVYLTGSVGADLPGDTTPASWLGRAMTIAGLVVAVLAPATGIWVDAPVRRRRVLALTTGAAVVLTSAMSLIRDDHRYLMPGLILLACAAACNEIATVPYNAMLRQLSSPETSGRISGLGLAMGYAGSVVLLLLAYVGFIAGDGDTRGLLGIPIQDGQNVRAVMLLTAVWFMLFALPMFVVIPRVTDAGPIDRVGFFGAYRKLWAEIRSEWQRDHNVVYYLVASAVFRDGLAGVFAFGAVLGVNVYGISEADVLLFGISACVIAAVGAVTGGLLDDRVGSKPIIVGSLVCLIVVGLSLLALSGPVAFWVCGLLLCLFIGPTLSSARTLMLRITADGKEGVAFGLYTTVGRAASFLAPWLFFTFIDVFGTDRAGMGGLVLVLALGLAGMLAVRTPGMVRAQPA
ncbi:MFS transporter [Mycobacterium sp. 21AC1]|uniref:MFS transporter n=1 Tax=[Mycobacterium] appelbergii TaxID=2939269 RepID=UPI002938FAD3|nr:MFS transporter [Mycobacterium sp. 21AC1]MDV3127745.1 MFS transporter [Mycobacterium sp. 21AC1]